MPEQGLCEKCGYISSQVYLKRFVNNSFTDFSLKIKSVLKMVSFSWVVQMGTSPAI
jgi:hypothetical protein